MQKSVTVDRTLRGPVVSKAEFSASLNRTIQPSDPEAYESARAIRIRFKEDRRSELEQPAGGQFIVVPK